MLSENIQAHIVSKRMLKTCVRLCTLVLTFCELHNIVRCHRAEPEGSPINTYCLTYCFIHNKPKPAMTLWLKLRNIFSQANITFSECLLSSNQKCKLPNKFSLGSYEKEKHQLLTFEKSGSNTFLVFLYEKKITGIQ